ncbi:MAG: PhoH family protein [Spirochaetales bacterium]|nr:PhoH family protein [Spirochaetales bacterium]
MGVRVFVRGNELSVESGDPLVRELFTSLVSQLLDAIHEGIPASPDLITAIHASLTPEGALDGKHGSCADLFRDAAIQVPGAFSKVYPRTSNQALYLRGLASHDISVAVGPAGTGKTYLAVAWALREVLSKTRRKIVLTRPVVEAGESLGFLPGDLGQKISPYLRPLYDAMEALVPYDVVRRLEDNHTIEIAPLAYMRGRSLNNCVVILDEAQNTTKEQMKMFLTRLGEGSAAVITGDVTQIDLPRKSESGLVHALTILSSIDEIFVCRMDGRDVVRNPLVRKIIDAYESDF